MALYAVEVTASYLTRNPRVIVYGDGQGQFLVASERIAT